MNSSNSLVSCQSSSLVFGRKKHILPMPVCAVAQFTAELSLYPQISQQESSAWVQDCGYSHACKVTSRGDTHIQTIYLKVCIDYLFLGTLVWLFASPTSLRLKPEVIHMTVCILFKFVFANTVDMCFDRVQYIQNTKVYLSQVLMQ